MNNICRIYVREPVITPISVIKNFLDYSGVKMQVSLDSNKFEELPAIQRKYKEYLSKKRILALHLNKWIPSAPLFDIALFPASEYEVAKKFAASQPDIKVFVEKDETLKQEHIDNFKVCGFQLISEYIHQFLKKTNAKKPESKEPNTPIPPSESSEEEGYYDSRDNYQEGDGEES